MKRPDITLEEIKRYIHYDLETGVFTWLVNKAPRGVKGGRAGSQYCTKKGKSYREVRLGNERYSEHRLAWFYVYGAWPECEIDHINGDGTDNRIINLRLVDRATNMKNARLRTDNKSGVCGIYWYARYEKWQAYITVARKRKHIGYFERLEDAACARKNAEKMHDFHINHGTDRPL